MELASADRLIQPECLGVETLRKLLSQRSVPLKDLPSDRGGLTNLYNRLILPLPQRVYNSSTRLGRKLHQVSSSAGTAETNSPSKQSKAEENRRQESAANGRAQLQREDLKRTKNVKHEPPGEGAPEAKKRKDITWP